MIKHDKAYKIPAVQRVLSRSEMAGKRERVPPPAPHLPGRALGEDLDLRPFSQVTAKPQVPWPEDQPS